MHLLGFGGQYTRWFCFGSQLPQRQGTIQTGSRTSVVCAIICQANPERHNRAGKVASSWRLDAATPRPAYATSRRRMLCLLHSRPVLSRAIVRSYDSCHSRHLLNYVQPTTQARLPNLRLLIPTPIQPFHAFSATP